MIFNTFTHTQTMVIETCCNCQMTFAITKDFYDRCQGDSDEWFYCPRGHRQHYSKGEMQKLRQELKSQQESIEYLRNANSRLHDAVAQKNLEIRAQKAAKTRLKNRVKNGVCPCCNRTFQNLADHMATQHPDFTV